jgi:hypothetical protein
VAATRIHLLVQAPLMRFLSESAGLLDEERRRWRQPLEEAASRRLYRQAL